MQTHSSECVFSKFTQRKDTFSSYDDCGQENSDYPSDLADITFAADNEIIGREEEAKFQKALKYMSDSEREIVLMAKEGYCSSSLTVCDFPKKSLSSRPISNN